MSDLLRLRRVPRVAPNHGAADRHFIMGNSPLYDEVVQVTVTTDELQACIDHLIDLHFECQQADTEAALADLASTEMAS
jgi:hypothetical protein